MIHRIGPWSAFTLCLALTLAPGNASASFRDGEPLAVVGPDTLTTRDLRLQLNVMIKAVKDRPEVERPGAGDVLTRMIQDRLIIQEGYRIGIDERFTVKNQVRSLVRDKSMTALLDSVASVAPADQLDRRRAAVESFISDLEESYAVRIDSTLLASLDYASADEAVKDYLRTSDEVLVEMSDRVLRVRGLTQVISWEEFHGLAGNPDAAGVRDEIFRKWLSETLVMLEAQRRGYHQRPEIVELAREVERALVHEETFRALVDVGYDPTEEEVEDFYRQNLGEFTPAPRIKFDSVMLDGEEPARKFCARLRKGAKLSWLAKQTDGVVPGPPPFSADWYAPEQLGVDPSDAVEGFVPEPYEVPGGGWICAVVAEVERPAPLPLEQCRRQVLGLMKGRHLQDSVVDVVARLEEESDVRILPGAEETVDKHLDAAFASLAKE